MKLNSFVFISIFTIISLAYATNDCQQLIQDFNESDCGSLEISKCFQFMAQQHNALDCLPFFSQQLQNFKLQKHKEVFESEDYSEEDSDEDSEDYYGDYKKDYTKDHHIQIFHSPHDRGSDSIEYFNQQLDRLNKFPEHVISLTFELYYMLDWWEDQKYDTMDISRLKALPNLKYFEIILKAHQDKEGVGYKTMYLDVKGLEFLLESKSLEHFSLNSDANIQNMREVSKVFTNLKNISVLELNLQNSRMKLPADFFDFSNKNLRTLKIHLDGQVDTKVQYRGIINVKNLENLQFLKIEIQKVHINNEILDDQLSHLSKLVSVDLTFNTDLTALNFIEQLADLKKLQNVKINLLGNFFREFQSLEKGVIPIKKLQNLDIVLELHPYGIFDVYESNYSYTAVKIKKIFDRTFEYGLANYNFELKQTRVSQNSGW